MEQRKTIEELLQIHGDELKEYLLALPKEERRIVCEELLIAQAEMEDKNMAEQAQPGRSLVQRLFHRSP